LWNALRMDLWGLVRKDCLIVASASYHHNGRNEDQFLGQMVRKVDCSSHHDDLEGSMRSLPASRYIVG
jgi:hypothetical protein